MLEMLVEKPRNGNVNGCLERKSDLFKANLDVLHYYRGIAYVKIASASIADCERSLVVVCAVTFREGQLEALQD
jgi:hypothetical protein